MLFLDLRITVRENGLDIFCRLVGFDFCGAAGAIISSASLHRVQGLAVYHSNCDTVLNMNVKTICTVLWMNRCIYYKIWFLGKQDKFYTVYISSSNFYLVEDIFLCVWQMVCSVELFRHYKWYCSEFTIPVLQKSL